MVVNGGPKYYRNTLQYLIGGAMTLAGGAVWVMVVSWLAPLSNIEWNLIFSFLALYLATMPVLKKGYLVILLVLVICSPLAVNGELLARWVVSKNGYSLLRYFEQYLGHIALYTAFGAWIPPFFGAIAVKRFSALAN